jgi:hypothetical protein
LITEQDLLEAIAECEGARNPNANTCIKLAAYYTILNNLNGEQPTTPKYSFASEPTPEIRYGNSEFSRYAENKGIEKVYPVVEELIDTIMVMNPRLYNSFIQKISEV